MLARSIPSIHGLAGHLTYSKSYIVARKECVDTIGEHVSVWLVLYTYVTGQQIIFVDAVTDL